VEVIPENTPMICLDNWGIIDPTHLIKHVEIVANGTLINNLNTKWRYLEELYMIPGKIDKAKKF
jgi:hypothetical protein